MRLLKLYLELGHLSMYKQWIYTKKRWFFFEKNDESILSGGDVITKNLWKHTKIQLFNGGLLDILTVYASFFKAVIYQCNFIYRLKYLWIDTNKGEWARCKTIKSRIYSLYTSSFLTIFLPKSNVSCCRWFELYGFFCSTFLRAPFIKIRGFVLTNGSMVQTTTLCVNLALRQIQSLNFS